MEFLSMHPDVVIARRDNDSMELQFFQNDLLYQDGQGLEWYRYHMHSKLQSGLITYNCQYNYNRLWAQKS